MNHNHGCALISCLMIIVSIFVFAQDHPSIVLAQDNVRQIAFSSNQTGDYDIYIINSDGSGLTNLTNTPGVNEIVQDWSRDGTKLLYTEGYAGGYVDGLDTIDIETKQISRLISGWSDGAKWSPDGKKIVYTCPQNGIDICVFDIETNVSTDLTQDNPYKDREPNWSSDGNKIIWARETGGYDLYRLYVMDANGENKTKVTPDEVAEGLGSWSHDGKTIAYHADVGGRYQLFTIPASGGTPIRITNNNHVGDWSPIYSPDDTQLVYYYSTPEAGYDIAIHDFSSNTEELLYSSPGDDLNPIWRPIGASYFPIPYGWETVSTTNYYHHAGGFVYNNGYIYAIGGYDGIALSSIVEYAPIRSNGDIGPWMQTSSLNTPSYCSAAVVAKGHLYLVGGRPELPPVWSNMVQVTEIQPDGSLGPWHQTSPMNLDRDNLGAVNIGNYIYAVGGSPEWNDQSSVEYAEILSNGDLGPWQYTTSMNHIRKAVVAATDGKCIYAIGGGTYDLKDSTNTVERACPNPDGTLGNWEYQSSMHDNRSYASAIAWQGKLIVMGGGNGYSALNSVEVAEIDKNGDLGEWMLAEPLQNTWGGAGNIVTDHFIYILGGTLDSEKNPTYNVDRAVLATNNPTIIKYVLYGLGGLVAAIIAIAVIYFVVQFFLSLRKYRSRA